MKKISILEMTLCFDSVTEVEIAKEILRSHRIDFDVFRTNIIVSGQAILTEWNEIISEIEEAID